MTRSLKLCCAFLALTWAIAGCVKKPEKAKTYFAPEPGSGQAMVKQAQTLVGQGDMMRARETFMNILKAHPKDAHALSSAGAFFAATGEIDLAIKAMESANRLGPFGTVEQGLAALYLTKGLPARTVTHARKALTIAPELTLSRMLLVDSLMVQGEKTKSYKEARIAVKRHPKDGGLWAAMGDAALALEKEPEARAAFGKALNLHEDNPRASLGLARIFERQKKPAEAVKVLDAALVLRAQPDVQINLARLLLKDPKRHDEALPLALQAHRVMPDNPDYKYTLATVLLAHGRAQEARLLLEEVVVQAPGAVDAWFSLEKAYWRLGAVDKSEAILEDMLRHPGLKLGSAELGRVKRRLAEIKTPPVKKQP